MSFKFRQKPLQIEAVQTDSSGHLTANVPDWIREAFKQSSQEPGSICLAELSLPQGSWQGYQDWRDEQPKRETYLQVFTPIGVQRVSPGDWIVQTANGDLLVVTPEHFKAIYEPVPDDAE